MTTAAGALAPAPAAVAAEPATMEGATVRADRIHRPDTP